MLSFIQRHAQQIKGVLSGLDRIRFRGTLRTIAHPWGLKHFLQASGVLLKDFAAYVHDLSSQFHRASEQAARALERPFVFLPSSRTSKEEAARAIIRRDGVRQGPVAVFRTLENCWSFHVVSNRATGFLEVRSGPRKCLHYYHYFLDPDFGLMHARVQSWLPFNLHVCLNGRDWLARQLDQAGIGYVQRDNCFTDVADFARAQQLLDAQVSYDWDRRLSQLVPLVQPLHARLFRQPHPYYWSVDESEWATDVVFRHAAALAALYPRLVRHGIENLSCHDVLRYLGRKHPEQCPTAEVLTDRADRPEGTRLKHWLNHNALKMYDKQPTVLRVEAVINQPEDFKVVRTAEGAEDEPAQLRKLRKGVVDLPLRAAVSQQANERYLEGLAAVEEAQPLGTLAAAVCQPATWQGRRVRALNPLSPADAHLLAAVLDGCFALAGLRNRDVRELLHGTAADGAAARRQSAAVTRQLRLLRGHGLLEKQGAAHRYVLTNQGRAVITALLAARQADTRQLLQAG
jgi:hypothetical protein